MPRAPAFLALISLVILPLSHEVGAAQIPNARDVVARAIYVSLAPLPRGRTFEIAIVGRIRSGFHINSHEPKEDYLIPTTMSGEPRVGIKILGVTYPPGIMHKFKFSPTELSVFEGNVTLRMKLEVAGDAPLGIHAFGVLLRYQACNDEVCLPPVQMPMFVEVRIVPAGAKAQSQYPEIFSAPVGEKTPPKK